MATKIRLQRHGKKGKAFFHIVIADSRSPRDGKFIEKLGVYNPHTNPATIEMEFERALHWLRTGAQPTETARAILAYKGVLYKNHLLNGVAKGALTEADVEKKFEAWVKEKEDKIGKKSDSLAKNAEKAKADRLKAEAESAAAKAAEIEAKNTPAPEVEEAPVAEESSEEAPSVEDEASVEVVEETAVTEEAPVVEEAPVAEETAPAAEEVEEAPVAEATEETPADEEEPKAE